ncbi:MAG: hypothetical protein KC444_10005 [Nitrosopumilus sp.]|nr:hypothetical protein [Nitrosopumilus sp.]
MKTKLLTIPGIIISASLIPVDLNHHREYDDQEFVYLFCEQLLFSGRKQCTVI